MTGHFDGGWNPRWEYVMNTRATATVTLLCLLLAHGLQARERVTQRDGYLRAGPGSYHEVVGQVARGMSVDAGETSRSWVACRVGAQQGWMPLKVFEKPRSGIDYSGFLAKTEVTVVSSVDIAAATKGAFSSSYSERHNVSFERAEELDSLGVDGKLVDVIWDGLAEKDSARVLGRLPPLQLDNDIALRPDAEALLGRALVARIVEKGFIKDAAVVSYVNAVAAVVASKTERYDFPYKVGVVDDPGVNGFGLPGGYVIITKGLLDRVQNESELACVLGHEMAHISRYHGLREFNKREVHRRRDTAFAELESVTGGTSTSEVEQDLNKLADTAYLTIIGGRARGDELEADLFGAAYAAAAGYDPQAMVAFLTRTATDSAIGPDMFSHHPELSERISTLGLSLSKYRLLWDGQKRMQVRYARYMGTAGG